MGRKISAGRTCEQESAAYEVADLAKALRDLEQIKASAAISAAQILTACETLLEQCEGNEAGDLEAGDLKDAAEAAAIEIMTACGFEDMVGQRATHASRLIDEVVAARLEALPCSSDRGERSEGDKVAEARLEQASVDALMAEKG